MEVYVYGELRCTYTRLERRYIYRCTAYAEWLNLFVCISSPVFLCSSLPFLGFFFSHKKHSFLLLFDATFFLRLIPSLSLVFFLSFYLLYAVRVHQQMVEVKQAVLTSRASLSIFGLFVSNLSLWMCDDVYRMFLSFSLPRSFSLFLLSRSIKQKYRLQLPEYPGECLLDRLLIFVYERNDKRSSERENYINQSLWCLSTSFLHSFFVSCTRVFLRSPQRKEREG